MLVFQAEGLATHELGQRVASVELFSTVEQLIGLRPVALLKGLLGLAAKIRDGWLFAPGYQRCQAGKQSRHAAYGEEPRKGFHDFQHPRA